MFDQATILSCSLFGAVSLIGWWLTRLLSGGNDNRRMRDRLSRNMMSTQLETEELQSSKDQFSNWFTRMGQAAAKPFMPDSREKQSELRRRLAMAGIYGASAIRVVTGFKVIFMAVGVVGGYLVGLLASSLLLGISIGGLVGYIAPIFWLKTRIKRQQKSLEYGLPDALDLMVICVESGLAMDAAMSRVGQELSIVHPRLSRELEITHMETRMGLSRTESLRNLGVRTGSTPLQSLSSMLIQAERFGTSIAGALKVHAESMRVVRQQKAEELAAKASVKMSFPLVLFIFPATFIVLAGPTIVELLNSSLFN
jgi:tight adherence protein C